MSSEVAECHMTSRHQAALTFLSNISLDGSHTGFETAVVRDKRASGHDSSTKAVDIHSQSANVDNVDSKQSDSSQFIDQSKLINKHQLHLALQHPVVLTTIKSLPYAIFSILPYTKENAIPDVSTARSRPPYTTISRSSSDVLFNPIERPAISYRTLLVPTHKQHSIKPLDLNVSGRYHNQWLQDMENFKCDSYYHPNLLDDPELRTGKHRVTLRLPSMMFSVLEYSKASDVKKDLNERFKERFPTVELTLSKLRSLKTELYHIAVDLCLLATVTVAYAYVYFEKLILKGIINKPNRKLIAGTALLLAIKMTADLKQAELVNVVDILQENLRINRRELFAYELECLIALEFSLTIPQPIIAMQYQRIMHENS